VALGAFCLLHPLEVARVWNVSATLAGWKAAVPAPDQPGEQVEIPAAPTNFPAHPNWAWQTRDGKTYANVIITQVSPTEVIITHSLGVAHLPLDSLPADVQQELHYHPPAPVAPPPPTVSLTPVAGMVNNKLIDAKGQPVPTPGPSIKYYAIYYSAGWCPPCHVFTPSLVDWYGKFKPLHHDFELIFVSEDKSETDMSSYMQVTQMPWPAVRYTDLPRQAGTFRGPDIQQYAGSGIPDLVLVDSTGKVLSDSFDGSNYVGPQTVIDYMNEKLATN
jgi:nucleoredoxin